MFAIIAAICFAISLLCDIIGGNATQYVLDFALGGALAIALHLALGTPWPWQK